MNLREAMKRNGRKLTRKIHFVCFRGPWVLSTLGLFSFNLNKAKTSKLIISYHYF